MQLLKVRRWLGLVAVFAIIGLSIWVAGCGGSGTKVASISPTGSTPVSTRSSAVGTLHMSVTWPTSLTSTTKSTSTSTSTGASSRYIPLRTATITVKVTSSNGFFADGTKTATVTANRPAPPATTTEIDVPEIPVGGAIVDVSAFDADGMLVARAPSQVITIQPGAATAFTATLVPEQAPAPVVQAVTFTPSPVTGGTASTGTITLSGIAPVEGALITLSSDNPAVMVPAQVTAPIEATSVTFPVQTSPVQASVTVNVTATYNNTSVVGTIQVNSLTSTLSGLTIAPTTVVGPTGATGTVTMDTAPQFPVVITLASDNSAVTVPATVTVPVGSTTATFPITTVAPKADQTANISATQGQVTQKATLVDKAVVVSALSINPSSVTVSSNGTIATANGTVTLSVAPPSAVVVSLSSSSVAASVPATVTIPAGSTSATFTITNSVVTSPQNVTITASYNSSTKTAALQLNPFVPLVSYMYLSTNSTPGGAYAYVPDPGNNNQYGYHSTGYSDTNVTGYIYLTGNAPSPVTVTLSATAGPTSVPSTITIPTGSSYASFPIRTYVVQISESGPYTRSVNSTITASANGSSYPQTLTVTQPYQIINHGSDNSTCVRCHASDGKGGGYGPMSIGSFNKYAHAK